MIHQLRDLLLSASFVPSAMNRRVYVFHTSSFISKIAAAHNPVPVLLPVLLCVLCVLCGEKVVLFWFSKELFYHCLPVELQDAVGREKHDEDQDPAEHGIVEGAEISPE